MGPVVTNQSVADIMYFMIQRSSLINALQLGKILVLILKTLARDQTTQVAQTWALEDC